MRLVLLSDTHGRHADVRVPDGDVLVHAGDLSGLGRAHEVEHFAAWLAAQPHGLKVVVAGNHDFLFEQEPQRARALLGDVHYLEDEGVRLGGQGGPYIWGSPWQPRFRDWAFNLKRGPALARVWARVPAAVDVLVTHTPPAGVLDRTWSGDEVGCRDLAHALERIAPRLHVFGHIHEARGVDRRAGCLHVNASICDRALVPVHAPFVVDWSDGAPQVVVGA